jgi:O-antigen/teichoic acid export membrane protein
MATRAGSALFWKGVQLSVTKFLYFARLLILARLLAPDDFGLFAIAAVVLGVLLTLSDLGIGPALVHKDEVDRRDYVVAWTLEILRALMISGLLLISAPFVAELFGEPRAVNIIRALALRPILVALASIQLAKLNRGLEFRTLAALKLPAAFIDLVVAVSLAKTLGVWAMVIGILAGEVATVIIAYTRRPWRPGFSLRRENVLQLVTFGRWIFLTGVIALAGGTVLQAVISRKLGTAELGLFYMALQLANLPSEVTDQVITPVAFPLYARLRTNRQRVSRAFRTIYVGMSAFLVPTYALLIVLAPSLTSSILGPDWAGTAPVIQILAGAGLISVLSDAAVPLLNGLGQPYKVTILESVQSFIVIVSVWYLAEEYGVVGAASALLPALFVLQFMAATFLRATLGPPLTYLLPPIVAIVLASVGGAILAVSMDRLFSGIGGFIAAALGGALFVFLIVWSCDRRLGFGIQDDVLLAFPQLKSLTSRFKKS